MSEASSISSDSENLWQGLRDTARAALQTRDYRKADLAERLATTGVEAGEIVTASAGPHPDLVDAWIPGVEIFPRSIYQQRHRGFFGELARLNDGRLSDIGLVPQQWASATMFAGTAKGFHIHPPHIPDEADGDVAGFFQKLFVDEPTNYAARPYDKEQWDSMFFVQGAIEFLLVDERVGMERRVMRFLIDGDNHAGKNNIGLVIPSGVAHALRCGSSEDVVMVYGTSTTFVPEFEGRIASDVETSYLPQDWDSYIAGK
jgi:dTDP-4-dehydrorhamnose 3,5-epimerase-like enzyme